MRWFAPVFIIMLVFCCSCRKGAGPGAAPGQQAAPGSAPGATQPMKPHTTDNGTSFPGAGNSTISGKVFFNREEGAEGNLFIFITDYNSLNDVQPRALASQIILSNEIPEGAKSVDFRLENVPTGEYVISVVWDTGAPFCELTVPVCAISLKDRAGQSQPLSVDPGAQLADVEIPLADLP